MKRFLPMALALALFAVACESDDDPSTTTATTVPTTTQNAAPTETATATATPEEPSGPGPVVAEPIAPDVVFERPVDALAYEDGILVADQGGVVALVRDGDGEAEVMLDIADRVLRQGNEEGLLSIALDPAFEENGWLWTYYSAAGPRRTVLSRFNVAEDGPFDPVSEIVVFQQEQPYPNHNGGAIRFGADGMLYLGLGDGGDAGDPHGNGQSMETLLGKIIRLDVGGSTEEALYAVPDDNPFVGEDDAREEIWALGLRNPWRMAFDPATDALWVADVGQGTVEEIDIVERGANLGWDVMEGDRCFEADTCDQDGLTLPVAVYTHESNRCSVSGGVVARDAATSNVEGSYLYADFCSGELWALPADDIEAGAEPVLIGEGFTDATGIVQVGDRVIVLAFGQPLLALINE